MNDKVRHLSWERFVDLVDGGPPAIEVVSGSPVVQIFTAAEGARIGIRTACDAEIPPSPLVEISIAQKQHGGEDVIEISTASRALYREFYSFCCAVADRVQIEAMPISDAIESALAAWESLLRQINLLSNEKQIGLLGELIALRRLHSSIGWKAAIEAWKGPTNEEHDFSWGHLDLEVKTTTSERRSHLISSLTQLEPSPDRTLHLLSIQLTGTGHDAGESLPEAVSGIIDAVREHAPSSLDLLKTRLSQAGWQSEHAAYYHKKLTLRTPLAVIPIDDACPRLTPAILAPLPADVTVRLDQVTYRIDVTGLGTEDEAPEFLAVLPKVDPDAA
jgi:hypothetical protein